ncbi:hypothetical protein [Actinoplanes couchii]|uniref:hypothetical protein n=1 Tax=Actinoplanes couchii TaxID=403638 RepID=UPI0019441AFF|nr:hypothetical protein [Actinoplanes couchii]MDR6319271.1 hypothetical protein [Actinoplanes couchii]
MTEESIKPKLRPSQQLAALLGFPEPKPLTAEEQRAFQEKLDRADDEVRAIIARRERRHAA